MQIDPPPSPRPKILLRAENDSVPSSDKLKCFCFPFSLTVMDTMELVRARATVGVSEVGGAQ